MDKELKELKKKYLNTFWQHKYLYNSYYKVANIYKDEIRKVALNDDEYFIYLITVNNTKYTINLKYLKPNYRKVTDDIDIGLLHLRFM